MYFPLWPRTRFLRPDFINGRLGWRKIIIIGDQTQLLIKCTEFIASIYLSSSESTSPSSCKRYNYTHAHSGSYKYKSAGLSAFYWKM
ncbi:hypothetical protein VTL71DRAFT_9219, partial [Oculimacula yallundae]